jgi:protein-disulfide isomerase
MRRKRIGRLRLALGGALLAIAVVAFAGVGSAGAERLDGIPQEGLTLGKAGAPVELIEYGDLECPICKQAAERVLPRVIRTQVATGKAKLTWRNFTIISPDSGVAGAAAIAAGEQGRGWSFIEAFLRRQRKEGTGYATDAFLESIAAEAGVEDLARWNEDRRGSKARDQVKASTREAGHKLDLAGTPTFAIRGPRTHGLKLLGTPGGAAPLVKAIEEAG